MSCVRKECLGNHFGARGCQGSTNALVNVEYVRRVKLATNEIKPVFSELFSSSLTESVRMTGAGMDGARAGSTRQIEI